MTKPTTLQEAIQHFSDPQTCIDTVAEMRWPDGVPTCPACEGKDHYYLKTQKRWKCKECYKQFTVKLGTIFEDSPLGLDKWLVALWLVVNCKNGISSYEVSRDLGISQKSAWFMLHRLRLAMKDISNTQLGGGTATPCEADETFIGGKVRNMHRSRRLALQQQRQIGLNNQTLKNETKTIIAGVLDRKAGKVRAEVVNDRKVKTLDMVIRRNVKLGSTIYTDDHVGYDDLHYWYEHDKLNKQVEGYVKGSVHTQGIENFWSLLKRGLGGTYVAVEPFHLSRYLDEQIFRFNNRKDGTRKVTDYERFNLALGQVAGRRLTFAEVTGKVGETTN